MTDLDIIKKELSLFQLQALKKFGEISTEITELGVVNDCIMTFVKEQREVNVEQGKEIARLERALERAKKEEPPQWEPLVNLLKYFKK